MTRRPPTTEIRIVLRTILSAGVLAVLLVLVLVLACAGTAAGATTWVVDDDGGADFVSIQAAVDAASDGDTIEVRSGTYVENVDVGKRLTLIGEGADVVTVRAADAGDHVFEVTAEWVNVSGFTVTGATATYYRAGGIRLINANHCNISENNASDNYNGIYLSSSSNNTLTNNNASSNKNNSGICLHYYSSNNILTGNTASSNSYGIHLHYYSSNNTLVGNTASSNYDGIRLCYSSNNTLVGNTASSNTDGIHLQSQSSNNTLTGNTASSNDGCGIGLYGSSNNTLTGNTASSNDWGGIGLYCYSSNNTLTGNTASSNSYGIHLQYSSNNTLTGNTASSNYDGILLYDSSNNTLYHNNLINSQNAYDTGTNQWDSGSEGNYYSDYPGADSDGDGIGDTSYPIPGGSSEDRYPLMAPYTPPTGPQDRSLAQVEGQPEVYWFQNNRLYWVTDWNVINAMSGVPGWDSVNTLPASEFDPATYPQGPRFITTGAESDGLLIMQIGDYKVYRIENGRKRHITYPDVMDLKGYSFDDVIEVSSEISDMFPLGDPIGIEVDLYFNKKTDSGDISHENQFTTGETVKSITETTVAEDYTVETYVRMIKPDGTGKFAYHENSNFQPTDPLQFSDIKRSLYPGTWSAQAKTWNWDEYTFDGTEMEGVYIWEFWYEDVASGKVLGKDVQGYEFTNTPPSPDDTTPPLVRIISPIDGDTVYDSYVLVSGIAFDSSGIETLAVNGQNVFSVPVYGVLAFGSLVNLKEGLNEITILARDDSENHNEIIGKIIVDYYPFNVKITSPKNGDIFKLEESILFKGEVNGGTPPFAYDWLINGEVKNSGTSDSGSIEYPSEGLALGEYRVKLRVMDFNGYIFETNEIQIYVTPPKPKIEAEIQRGGEEVTNVEMGEKYELVVRLTNLDQNHAYSYSLGIDQVRHNIPRKTWDPELNLENSQLKTELISPGKTKEYRFEFENEWKWIDETGYWDVVGIIADEGAILVEDPTVDLSLLAQDVVETYMQIIPTATQPIRTVSIDFEPSPSSTNSLISADELKKNVEVEIPYTDVKFSSFVMSIIWTWAGNAGTFGWDFLTGGPILDSDLNIAKKLGNFIIGGICTFDSKAAYDIAVDPNNDFEIVVEPEPICFPELSLMEDNIEKELVYSYLDLSSTYYALRTSYIRYAGASEADEPYYMMLQLEAAKKYSIQLIQKMEEIQRLHNILFNNIGDIDEAQIEEIQNNVSTNGLSEVEMDFLTREGLEELTQFRIERILNSDPEIYSDPDNMFAIIDLTTQVFIVNSEELMKEIISIRIDQLGYTELTATSQEIDELENLRNIIQNGLNDGTSYEELNDQIQLMITKSEALVNKTNNISYVEYYNFATQSWVENMNSFEPYNITFLPPITTPDHSNLTNGRTLPIKFTARDNDTGEFIYDDTVNVTITNSTGHLIAFFTNGTGTDSVRINSTEEQYIVNFHTKDYDLNVGETYTIHVTFGEADTLRGYAITHFTLVDRKH